MCRNQCFSKPIFLITVLLLLCIPTSLFALTAEEIIGKMDYNTQYKTSYSIGSIQTKDRFGLKTSTFKAWSQGNAESLIEFTSTAEQGQKILKTNDSLYLFYPDAEQLIRMQGSALRQSLLGSDVSYEDMTEEKDTLSRYTATLNGNEIYKGRPCYVITLKAKTRSVAYPIQKIWVDSETFLTWKGEYSTKEGRLLKEMETLETMQVGEKVVASESRISDKMKKDSETIMKIESLEVDIPLDKNLFSLENLTW
ncbi:outer membrane lipoprotein-sorting protein [uncultured Sphaerochaeta sp.]|uniref:outer membrane lipoprotein-sorting protein n=1 Tax=uncultured Sphaerochaeta sp. TaxID=886478 RepID=UPI002A0A3B2C|nr:outer membrane lipoprotein-sorting protein [uncultured Sphaerochaeta sp.]